jgi:2-deoxy-D-gluconate 3-dehydrogenase
LVVNPFDLQGKNAVVTGANTGLGQAMAVALARAGARIALVGRSTPDDTQAMIVAAGGEATVVMADLSSSDVAKDVIAESEAALGSVDILVNNAGIIRRQDALEFSELDWDDVMATNLKVPFFSRSSRGPVNGVGGAPGENHQYRVAAVTSRRYSCGLLYGE